jgi:hypothetical protein
MMRTRSRMTSGRTGRSSSNSLLPFTVTRHAYEDPRTSTRLQEHSGLLMKTLHDWMEAQLAERKTEPNSGLGKAIRYMFATGCR